MKRLYIAIPALLAVTALGGCTGATDSASPSTSGGSSSSSTSTAKSTASATSSSSSSSSASAKASSTLKPNQEVDAKQLMGKVEDAMKGVKTYTLKLDSAGNATTVEYDQTDKNNVKVHNTSTVQGKKVETLLIGKNGYQKTEPATKWKKVEVPSVNPNDLINNGLKNGASKAVYVGSESIDGVQTDHYTVTIAASTSSVSPSSSQTAASSQPSASVTVPVDIWIDGQNRFVQQKSSVEALGAKVEATNKYTNYDKPLDIKEPASSEVE